MAVLDARRKKKRSSRTAEPEVRTRPKKKATRTASAVPPAKKASRKAATDRKAATNGRRKAARAAKVAAKASPTKKSAKKAVSTNGVARKRTPKATPENALKIKGFDVLTKRTACNGLYKQGSILASEKQVTKLFGDPFDVSRDTRSTATHRWNIALPMGVMSLYGPFGNMEGPRVLWHIAGKDPSVLRGLRKVFEKRNLLKVAGSIEKYVRQGGPRSDRQDRSTQPPPRRSARATREEKERRQDERSRAKKEDRARKKMRRVGEDPAVRKTAKTAPDTSRKRGVRAAQEEAPVRRKKLKRRRLASV